MALSVNPVENHREREKGVIVYPVYSRRSQGLSVGINLFPGRKVCAFDCPYCEVFPFASNAEFSLPQMEEDLRSAIISAAQQKIPVKDICFSGNGEPSLSPDFPAALELAAIIRAETVPDAALVLITNGTGLLHQRNFSLLKEAATGSINLDIWLKLDAGTSEWYKKINRAAFPFEELIAKIKEFASCAPVTIQTMLCSIEGSPPPPQEAQAWTQTVQELAASGNIKKVQIYGKARPSPEDPLASVLPESYLEERAAYLQSIINSRVLIEIFP